MSVLDESYDLIVVGGGPAGMAAAVGARDCGAERILVVDREPEAGGILMQCIHSGFGLHYFKEELSGPEYAERFLEMLQRDGISLLTSAYVSGVAVDSDGTKLVRILSRHEGLLELRSRSVVLAMGCRERTRGAIRIPGTRPAGVLTAGLAQKLVNMRGQLPGRRIAILGSGDIGLIMARRLALEGCEVVGVFELAPYSNGLSRNVVQCLDDFAIPLHLSTTVTAIHGRDRVERITVAPVDEKQHPITEKAWDVDCDTLLLSIGLIPENELSQSLGIRLDVVTGGPAVSSTLETSLPGVFACGNVLHVHDLVDFATQEALLAGRFAAEWARGVRRPEDNIRLLPGDNVRYCVPHTLSPERAQSVALRCKQALKPCLLKVGDLLEKRLPFVVPAEMILVTIKPDLLRRFHGDNLRIDIRPLEAKA
ncbi:MAG: FAD-dependent oxidoreductase [Myxococcota bacterium]|jgi:NADPH-dependent 2,4-dienoyl-CoA reductase/sulfur reductase-like enzyme|nr:FAD-dependent oxidoreductase [Myxococcota bacterium]